jgi:hypothetical protein
MFSEWTLIEGLWVVTMTGPEGWYQHLTRRMGQPGLLQYTLAMQPLCLNLLKSYGEAHCF